VSSVKERVKADLEASRLWKARDRLKGVLRVDPANQWALDQLGGVYYRMGDLPEAGRAWYLTARTGSDWEAAETAFYGRYGKKPANVVAALHVRAAIDRYPPEAQERLQTLQQRLRMEGRFWEPRDRPRPVSVPGSIGGRVASAAGALVVVLLLVALVVGLYNIVLFLIDVVQRAR
jgi:tetratricopeptide (TPR) repeat protein